MQRGSHTNRSSLNLGIPGAAIGIWADHRRLSFVAVQMILEGMDERIYLLVVLRGMPSEHLTRARTPIKGRKLENIISQVRLGKAQENQRTKIAEVHAEQIQIQRRNHATQPETCIKILAHPPPEAQSK